MSRLVSFDESLLPIEIERAFPLEARANTSCSPPAGGVGTPVGPGGQQPPSRMAMSALYPDSPAARRFTIADYALRAAPPSSCISVHTRVLFFTSALIEEARPLDLSPDSAGDVSPGRPRLFTIVDTEQEECGVCHRHGGKLPQPRGRRSHSHQFCDSL